MRLWHRRRRSRRASIVRVELTSGSDRQQFQEATLPALAAGVTDYELKFPGFQFGAESCEERPHRLTVYIDSTNVIAESNESNNSGYLNWPAPTPSPS